MEEVFHKKYPKNVRIQPLSTEYVVSRIYENGESLLHSIHADMVIQIGQRDRYHFECQMSAERNMVLRMFEYDVHVALIHGDKPTDGKRSYDLMLPKSVILYLTHSKRTPDCETCTLHFQDGTSHLYQVPVLKIQDYSLKMIEEKHLNMLIPFLPIRFKGRINSSSSKTRKKAEKDLTDFLKKCIIILNHEKENGTLTENAFNDIVDFLARACIQLFAGKQELLKEVHEIMEPLLKTRREIWQEEMQEKMEDLYKKFISKSRRDGNGKEETASALQEIFSLNESEAKEKADLYWKDNNNDNKES